MPGLSLRALIGTWAALWLASTPCPAGGPKKPDRPNILWITVEDMSPTLGCWGDTYARTPNIDALAGRSITYSRAFATAPVCSPSRSCLITGCYATSLGTQRLRSAFPVPDYMTGFPSLLRQAGYYCTNNVKTDYNTANEKTIIKASWDECSRTAHWRRRKQGQPFFCVFNDMTSHQSRTMVWPYEQFQKQVQSRLTPGEIHDPQRAPVPPYYPDTPIVRRTIARYYDCITVMDQNTGRLLRQLEEDGLAENTIVFFFSDHGSGMPRHKRALLDSGLHVPLFVFFPKRYRHLAPAPAGTTVDRLVSFVDFPPSVLSLCGIEIPSYMQGVPFLGPSVGAPRQYVFGARDRVDEVLDLARSVRDQRYLYIRNYMPHLSYHQPSAWPDQSEIRPEITRVVTEQGKSVAAPLWHYAGPTRPLEELYDVQADPRNLNNLANLPQHREELERMRGSLRQWEEDSHDFGFVPEALAWQISAGSTPFDVSQDPQRYPLSRLLEAAALVGQGPQTLSRLQKLLVDKEPAIRYWGAVGLVALGKEASSARAALVRALGDQTPSVRIEAANALQRMGHPDQALPVLNEALRDTNLEVVLHAARTIELLGPRVCGKAIPQMRKTLARVRRGGGTEMFVRFSVEAFLQQLDAADDQK